MLLFVIFCLAGGAVRLTARWGLWDRQLAGGARGAGVGFVGAVLLALCCGLAIYAVASAGSARLEALPLNLPAGAAPSAFGEHPPVEHVRGAWLLLLTGALYTLSALRGARGLPAWIADVLVVGAALLSVTAFAGAGGGFEQPAPLARPALYGGTTLLAVLWMWAMARMTAALNRTPQVTGGYLGIVALTLFAVLRFGGGGSLFFASAASAALAGAGLASVPVALRRPGINLGWSAALAMGFLLAQIAATGLVRNTALAILTFSVLALGLPLLDVSFFRLRAALRGQKVDWEEHRVRLHEALRRRGITSTKVTLLYLAMGVYLCGLGAMTARFLLSDNNTIWHFMLIAAVIAALLFAGFVVFFSLTRILMRRGLDEAIPEDVEAFGVRISPVSMSEALTRIESFIESGQPHHVVTSDANAILRAREDAEYAGIIRRAALITPDGFGVIWGARLLNLPIYERVTGVDMVTGICERAARRGQSIYILGSAPGIAATAAQKLSERFPGLRVAGTQHGYFKPEEEPAVVAQIRDARPDVLFVAFGIPKQEKFIARYLQDMAVPVCLGVGGSFDVYSEKLKRAPQYIQRSGMEWLYRVWQEPSRWKRLGYVPRFMLLALREWLLGPPRGPGATPTNAAP